jgi:branched-chain amino acid transport system ATP-binding protein
MTMLSVQDLTIRYGQATAVRGVSFEVGEGEFVGLVGPNGAGKTSILNTLSGIVTPAGGTITFNGQDMTGKRPELQLAAGLSLVPENRRIFTTMTVEENLRLGATIRKGDPAVEQDLERMLEMFPVLRRYFTKLAGLLSGGEQQMLAIARAVLSNPKLLLLDEPSLGLAPKIVDLVFEVLVQLRSEGMTVLLVEQNVRRTIETADRTYVLRNGSVVVSGTSEELASVDMSDAYFGGTQ